MSKENPYEVPPGYKGFWLNKVTFIVVKESANEADVRERFKNRKGPSWELGYIEQYHASPNKPHIRIRRAD
jgi:hypothetical protein